MIDAFDYTAVQADYMAKLAATVEGGPIQMAVVDYLGRVDADGVIGLNAPLSRRFGIRSRAHCKVYDLKVVWRNQAWLDASP